MDNYETVVEALEAMKKKGYTLNFNIGNDKIHCSEHEIFLHPDDFEITETHRFDGGTSPDDEDVLYAVESKDGKLKGTITAAFGIYADSMSNEMIKKLSVHH